MIIPDSFGIIIKGAKVIKLTEVLYFFLKKIIEINTIPKSHKNHLAL